MTEEVERRVRDNNPDGSTKGRMPKRDESRGKICPAKETSGVGGNGVSVENQTIEDMTVEELRKRMEEMRKDLMNQVNNQLNDMVSEVVEKLKSVSKDDGTKGRFNDSEKYRDKRKSSKEGALLDKEFVERNSLLNDLFEVKHIRTIYNIFVAILIILFINTVVHDVMVTGKMNVGINTIVLGFGKITTVAQIWAQMMAATFGTYVAFNLWGHRRLEFSPKSTILKIWDYGWLAIFVLYQTTGIVYAAKAVLDEDLPLASSLIILMEQTRILMKTHAFVRSNAPLFLSYKPHAETPRPSSPEFSHFLYFLFAPTLVYRNKYPRSKKIRWKFVVWNFTEVLLVIICVALTYERCLLPAYQNFGKHPYELKTLLLTILSSSMPAILIFLCGFYCLLHSWMNAWAELLRFADRLFYKDWWNSTSYAGYYRTWNVVVHDWLYTYVYKDFYEILAPGNKILSFFMVFITSAIFHEYILTFAFRFFYPVLLVLMFATGGLVMFDQRRIGNLTLWWSLCVGTGIVLSLYTLEYYARVNCPRIYDGFLDYVVPRSWSCHKIIFPWNANSSGVGRN